MLNRFHGAFFFAIFSLVSTAFATTLPPGSSGQAPDVLTIGTTTLQATTSGTITTPRVSGNYTENVYSDSNNVFCSGCLDFIIRVGDTSGDIEQVTASSFASASVDAGYESVAGPIPTAVAQC